MIIASALFAMVGVTPSLVSQPHETCPDHRLMPEYVLEKSQQDSVVPMAQWPNQQAIDSHPQEKHLKNIRQLTFGGQNAEAYWSKDGKQIVFQSLQPGFPDEQIFLMNADGSNKRLISTGKGRCTCSYLTPNNQEVFFSSTHTRNEGPQKKLDRSKGYVWMVNPDFALFKFNLKSKKLQPILSFDGYIAETTIDPSGKFMTWTSDKDGDLELYRSDLNGKNIVRLTNEFGYDGGPFVSWDGKKIVYRRDYITTEAQRTDYSALLKEHLVRPSRLEVWIMDSDGRNKSQVTKVGGASFAPFLHPDGKRIIFCSNFEDPRGREFDLYTIRTDGSQLERITYSGDFDGFPMFSRDGKKLVFASNRNGKVPGETNVFVADWVD